MINSRTIRYFQKQKSIRQARANARKAIRNTMGSAYAMHRLQQTAFPSRAHKAAAMSELVIDAAFNVAEAFGGVSEAAKEAAKKFKETTEAILKQIPVKEYPSGGI